MLKMMRRKSDATNNHLSTKGECRDASPEGDLYVEEAGTGGTTSTKVKCTQVPAPVGPYTGGPSARISKIDSSGTRLTVACAFPSAISPVGTLGEADLVFVEDTLYLTSRSVPR